MLHSWYNDNYLIKFGAIKCIGNVHAAIIILENVEHCGGKPEQADAGILSGVTSSIAMIITSLVPRPPPFLSFICDHNNTRERETGKKRERPGSIHHVNDVS